MRVMQIDGGVPAVRALSGALRAALEGGETVLPVSHDTASLAGNVHSGEPVEPDTALIVLTSGSTGAPKGVLLSARALTASAKATHVRLGGPGHWLLATPAHYIGGLQVLIRSLLAGTTPGVMDLTAGFRPAGFAEAADPVLRESGPRYTALVPTQLARLLDAGGAALAAVRAFDAVLIGGAALPTELRERAADDGVAVISAYGMSETAGGCVYDGVPLDGVHISTDGETPGRIKIAGDVLANGYRSAPEATAAAFADGWFHTSDLGRVGGGRLEVIGRADDVINTGGVKVAAAAVERTLRRHPGVHDVAVVGLPDAEWGEVIAAAVVATDPAHPPAACDLAGHVRSQDGAPAAPKEVRVVDALPLVGPGKVDRSAVRRLLEEPSARNTP
ncbi:MAG: AMP-binding protein [Actinophytocola sp.]|nr:AMP-binding protein [Actinophytocola sp.]